MKPTRVLVANVDLSAGHQDSERSSHYGLILNRSTRYRVQPTSTDLLPRKVRDLASTE
jgi:hypothetical protein